MFLAVLLQLSNSVSKEAVAEYMQLMFLSFHCRFMIHCHHVSVAELLSFKVLLLKIENLLGLFHSFVS